MADEMEETSGPEPKDLHPEDQTGKVQARSGTEAGANPPLDAAPKTQANAAADDSQKEAGTSVDRLMSNDGAESETLTAGAVMDTAVASGGAEAEATSGEESGAEVSEGGVEEDSWDRQTVSPSASVSAQSEPVFTDEFEDMRTVPLQSGSAKSDSAPPPPAASPRGSARGAEPRFSGGWGSDLNKPGLGLLYDVELDATLQFGSKEMLLRDVLELGPGDVVELDRHIAEPVDLVVGDRIVARGEVVVASGNFALRVTEVATPQMRLESIRCLF